jgi:hypothetical protein
MNQKRRGSAAHLKKTGGFPPLEPMVIPTPPFFRRFVLEILNIKDFSA